MSITIPTHKITDHAESGISIRRLTPDIVMPVDRPLHREIKRINKGMSVRSHRRSQRLTNLLLTLLSLWHIAKRWKALVK